MDTFATSAIRRRVLDAWAASPARFREDANAEEELARGAYRDRVVVELAQNAADAAARHDGQGRLLLRLEGLTLTAANTGAELDAAGVEGLSTLRASAKRDELATVGRFGVGFASVLAVTDEPVVLSRSGGVRWSRVQARELAAGVPELEPELARRGTAVPVLRLPYPASGQPPEGYDTAVVLPLRDGAALALARDLLAAVDEALLLMLPALAEVVVDVDGDRRTLRAGPSSPVPPAADESPQRPAAESSDGPPDRSLGEPSITLDERTVGLRWRSASLAGTADPALLADRPVEERDRPAWSVTVAVPVHESGGPGALPASLPTVVHAPTPTDDRTDLGVLVIATFPLDSSRRRVAPGALTDHLVAEVGRGYAALVASFGSPDALSLVPSPLGAGELDAALHRSIADALSATAFVPTMDGRRIRPRDAVVVDGLRAAADPSVLAGTVSGLPDPAWTRGDGLRRLGARDLALADLVDQLSALRLEPAQWRSLYAGLDGADPESLGALPVPLLDGRVIRGPRGLLMAGELDPGVIDRLDLRVVHPDAAHPLLRRLGAVEATPASVLRDPRVRAALDAAADDGDPVRLTDVVLDLVAASGLTSDDEPWLAELAMPDRSGEPAPARDLLLPGSELIDLLDADPDEYVVAGDVLDRHGAAVLRSVGVRSGPAVVRESDVALDDEFWHDLDDEDGWRAAVEAMLPSSDVPPLVSEFVAVGDLDLIRADAWPDALRLLAADQLTRAAVVDRAWIVLADGTRRSVPSYAAWWLRTHARIDGRRLDQLCSADADDVVRALLHPVELDVDPGFAAALGVVGGLADADTGALLDRMADPSLEVAAAVVIEVYARLADRDPPARVPSSLRVPDGLGSRVVPASDVVVIDGPHWRQLDLGQVLPAPASLADVLDVDLASEVYDAVPSGRGESSPVPDAAAAVLRAAPTTYLEHDDLVVAGHPVDWWMDGEVVHAATLDGLARGLAWASGQWERRWMVAEALHDPGAVAELIADSAWEDGQRWS